MGKLNIFYHYEVYDSNVKKCSISTLDSRLISVTAFYVQCRTAKTNLEYVVISAVVLLSWNQEKANIAPNKYDYEDCSGEACLGCLI